MRKTIRQLPLVLLILISACSDSSVFTEIENTDTTNTNADSNTDANTDANADANTNNTNQNSATEQNEPTEEIKFDLSLYLFHTNTETTGGEISYTEKYYEKPSGNGPIHTRTRRFLNRGTNIFLIGANSIDIQQYSLSSNSIKEIGVIFSGSQTLHRYNEVGKQYLDSIIEDLGRRDTCTLKNHLDEFDLGEATGSANIGSGVYEDVLHVFCNRLLDLEDGTEPINYSWNAYYAKGVGLIFAEGNRVILNVDSTWFKVGETYVLPEY